MPTRTIPALRHQNTEVEQVVFESGAILLYLAEWQGRFLPQDADPGGSACNGCSGRLAVWGRWRGKPIIYESMPTSKMFTRSIDMSVSVTNYMRCSKVTFRRILAWLDRNSIADIAVLPWVYRHARHGIDLAEYPSVLNWHTELMARPAVKTGLSVGQALISGGDFGSASAKRSLF